MKKVFEAIKREREFQDKKWGSLDKHRHELLAWIGIMEQELSEAKLAYFRVNDEATLKEILQTISVGVACLEQYGIVER